MSKASSEEPLRLSERYLGKEVMKQNAVFEPADSDPSAQYGMFGVSSFLGRNLLTTCTVRLRLDFSLGDTGQTRTRPEEADAGTAGREWKQSRVGTPAERV